MEKVALLCVLVTVIGLLAEWRPVLSRQAARSPEATRLD